jgi:hypothetical protein
MLEVQEEDLVVVCTGEGNVYIQLPETEMTGTQELLYALISGVSMSTEDNETNRSIN